jgi:hypothetical protein
MRRWIPVLGALALWAQKPQPIPFSHKTHARAGLACAGCHPGFPNEDQCMACHAAIRAESPSIRKLAAYQKERKRIPWARIYTLPDYVVFSHETHRKGRVGCAECHGPVAERDVLDQEKPLGMPACMDCHERRRASNACDACHPPF